MTNVAVCAIIFYKGVLMEKITSFMIEAVKSASRFIFGKMEVSPKGDFGDLVTNMDYNIEKYLIEQIQTQYPEFSVVSEEFNTNNLLTQDCFVIDPVDGTVNFANGMHLYGIQMACVQKGTVVASVIYLPALDEMYYADKNGAFLNDVPITVSQKQGKYNLCGIEGLKRGKGLASQLIDDYPGIRMFHCSAVNFAWTACGRMGAVIFLGEAAWDYLPGMYLVERAGGVSYNEKDIHIVANDSGLLEDLVQRTRMHMHQIQIDPYTLKLTNKVIQNSSNNTDNNTNK